MDNFDNICIIIPAFQPSELLLNLVNELLSHNYRQIVVINDGSDASKQPIFEQLKRLATVTVITHPKNLGKGEALKSGLRFALKNYDKDILGIVTVDADGQHLSKDVHKIAVAMQANPDQLILGVRKFDRTVPFRSRFGNVLTSLLFRWRYKINLKDTQTGLRGIPYELMKIYVALPKSRYEYEMLCLLQAAKSGYPILQIGTETVYLKGNISSHFHPVIDSMRVYYVFMRYSIISLLSYLIDLSLFVIFHYFTKKIFISLLIARIFSSSFNFYQNKFAVYRSHQLDIIFREAISYILVVLVFLLLSYLGITFLVHHKMNVIVAKVLVDALLFFINFLVQKKFVFK